ncbi:MAG: ABC transporter substrate-binding protein [Actinobacteria bacterium]|nr:ABC transporter substrate-binding protein [Actinomycetota bacterium]
MKKGKVIIAAVLALTIVVGAAMVLGGCGKKEEAKEEIQEGGTFNYCLISDPVSLDPAQLQESQGIEVGKQIFDGLMDNDPETMELVPAMAESYEVNEDATVFTFKLKKGVKFHNGRECKAEDFVYSWNRVCDPATASEVSYHMSAIKGYKEFNEDKTATSLEGVKALDDYTLEVTLAYPYADFVYHTAHPVFSPIPKEVVEQYGSENFSEHPVGTGPFKFVSWTHEQQIVVEKNADYYGENKPHLDKVVFKVYQDEETAYQDFKAGSLDDAQIPQGQFEAAAAEYGDRAIFKPMLGIYYYGFNMNTAPWKDSKALRQAFNYAVDRETLCNVVMEGQRIPATGIVPPGIPGYQAGAMKYTYDPEKAKELLKEAGFPGGQGLPALTLGYNTGVGHDVIAQFIQGNLKDVGVNFGIEGYEWGTYLDLIQGEQITFFRLGWLADYPIMDNFLYPLFHSENAGVDNMSQYKNAEVDKLLLEARRTPDEDARLALYREAEKLILEDAPIIPLMFYKTSRVYSDKVGGYMRTADDITPLDRVYFKKTAASQ